MARLQDRRGIEPDLLSQFPLLEDALVAFGVVVWPMVEYEADDALGAAAVKAATDPRVTQVRICTPDKDLRSASAARASSRRIDCGGRFAMRPA